MDQYRIDIGRYPTSEQGLNSLMQMPNDEPKWAGPYLLKKVPSDPWGKPYLYKSPGDNGEYDLYSFGKDGVVGGIKDAQDIVSW